MLVLVITLCTDVLVGCLLRIEGLVGSLLRVDLERGFLRVDLVRGLLRVDLVRGLCSVDVCIGTLLSIIVLLRSLLRIVVFSPSISIGLKYVLCGIKMLR